MSELEESKIIENMLFKRSLTNTPTPPPPNDGGETDTLVNPNPTGQTQANDKTVFNQPKGGSMNPTQVGVNVTDESNKIPSVWTVVDEKRGIYKDQFGNYGYEVVGPTKSEIIPNNKNNQSNTMDPYTGLDSSMEKSLFNVKLGSDPSENKAGEIVTDSPVFFNDDTEGGIVGRVESIIEGTAQKGRDLSAFLFTKASDQNVLFDYGAIPTTITAGAVRLGVGILEGVTFPFRPIAWKNTITTILTEEGRAGIMDALKTDPLGTGLETIGGVIGGKLAAKGTSYILDKVKGPKGQSVELTEVNITSEFDDVNLKMNGKYGQAKVLKTTVEPTGIITKEIPRKAFKTLTELNDSPEFNTILGYSEKLGAGYELQIGASGIDDLLSGKKISGYGTYKGAIIETPAQYTKPFGFINTIDDWATGKRTQFLDWTKKTDIFKEMGVDSAFTDKVDLKTYLRSDEFRIKVTGGLQTLDDAPEPPTTPIKPNPVDFKTSLNKTFGFDKKSATPTPTPKIDSGPIISLTTKTTGQNGIPVTRFYAKGTNLDLQGTVIGVTSGVNVREKAGLDTDTGLSDQTGIKPVIINKIDVNNLTKINPVNSLDEGVKNIITPKPIVKIIPKTTPEQKPFIGQLPDMDVKPVTITNPIVRDRTDAIVRQEPLIKPKTAPTSILNPNIRTPKPLKKLDKPLSKKPKIKKDSGIAGAEFRIKGVQTAKMVKKRFLKL